MTELLQTGRGYVNTWQCDENDHLNVQFYTAFADEASAHLHATLGLGPRRRAQSGLTLRVVEDHIRYHRELRVEAAVEVRSAPVGQTATSLLAYHEIRNAYDGWIAATVRRLSVYHDSDGREVPWPAPFAERARLASVPAPAHAEPRSAGRWGDLPDIELAQAGEAGLIEIGRGAIGPAECDAHGYLLPARYFARYSDGAAHLWHGMGFDRGGMRDRQHGTVVLEIRQSYRRPLRAGELFAVATGLLGVSDKTLHFAHFMFEVESGRLAATADTTAVLFDQRARKAMPLTGDARARLQERLVRGVLAETVAKA